VSLPPPGRFTALIAQAQGMVAAQADCTTIAALAMMRDRSRREGRSLEDIAQSIIDGRDRFGE
jgi:AmiR/NasT family two-component response regulator